MFIERYPNRPSINLVIFRCNSINKNHCKILIHKNGTSDSLYTRSQWLHTQAHLSTEVLDYQDNVIITTVDNVQKIVDAITAQ